MFSHNIGSAMCIKRFWLFRTQNRPKIKIQFLLLVAISVSISFHQLRSIHQTATEKDYSNEAHSFAIPAAAAASRHSTTQDTTKLSRSSSVQHDTSRLPPESTGACHNLSWWTNTNTIGPSNSTSISESIRPSRIVWVASFPGSGAEMFRTLIEALTGGLPAWSVYIKDNPVGNTTCSQAHAATCKTHWPVLDFRPVVFPSEDNNYSSERANRNEAKDEFLDGASSANTGRDEYHSQAIVLLRNPVSGFPSRFNHQWELKHNVGFHVRQAPERAWNNFIKRNFHHQKKAFSEFVATWANLSSSSPSGHKTNRVALFVPYEGLIDPFLGPIWTRRIVRVLNDAGVRHIDEAKDDIECLWKDAIVNRPSRKRAAHTYTPGYTPVHQQELRQMLRYLSEIAQAVLVPNKQDNKTSVSRVVEHQGDLASILTSYLESVQTSTSIRIL